MTFNHLQLNTSTLRDTAKVAELIKSYDLDFACLQEIAYPIGQVSPLKELLGDKLNYIDGVHFHYLPKNQSIGVAVVSKYPVIDVVRTYFNTPNFQPKTIKPEDEFSGTLLNDSAAEGFPGSRGIKHSIKSRCILSVLIETKVGLVRVVTTHFTVSDVCTETTQMFQMAQQVNSLVGNSMAVPTIFAADLNLRAQSYSVEKLKEVLTCHTQDLKDTLAVSHPAKKNNFPDGLAIDHVFSKGLKHEGTETLDIDYADHKAVLSRFSLGN